MIIMNRRGQTWTIEFVLGFLIFTAALILSVKHIYNIYSDDGYSDLEREGYFVSDILLSSGFPVDWDFHPSDVLRFGVVDNGSLSVDKLMSLYGLDYSQVRYLANTRHDFFVSFERGDAVIPLFYDVGAVPDTVPEEERIRLGCGYGSPKVELSYDPDTGCSIKIDADYTDLVNVVRVTSFNGSLVVMRVYIWK